MNNQESTTTTTIIATIQQWFLLLSILFFNNVVVTTNAYEMKIIPYGFQTSSDQNLKHTFGSTIQYDRQKNILFVTGATYSQTIFHGLITSKNDNDNDDEGNDDTTDSDSCDCFIGIVQLPSDTTPTTRNNNLNWLYTHRLGESNVPEACTSLQYVSEKEKVYMIGNTEDGGLETILRPYGSSRRTIYGLILDVDIKFPSSSSSNLNPNPDTYAKLKGGHLMRNSQVSYPISITKSTDEIGQPYLYTVTMISDEKSEISSRDNIIDSSATSLVDQSLLFPNQPDLTLDRKYGGSSFSIRLQQFKNNQGNTMCIGIDCDTNEIKETLDENWSEEYETSDSQSIFVSNLEYIKKDILLLAGTTSGYGMAFGMPEASGFTSGDSSSTNLDGFISKLDATTGKLSSTGDGDALRISSDNKKDDIIGSICTEGDNPSEVNGGFVYVVGSTKGIMTFDGDGTTFVRGNDSEGVYHAFIMKVDVNTMSIVWKKQFDGIVVDDNNMEVDINPDSDKLPHVMGLGCAVTSDSMHVYMVGNIYNDAKLRSASSSNPTNGGNDVFIIQIEAYSGNVQYQKQVGTSQNEYVGTNKPITTDLYDNAIIMGQTQGDLFQEKKTSSDGSSSSVDMFVMLIDKDTGTAKKTVENGGTPYDMQYQSSNGVPPPPPPPIIDKPTPQPQSIPTNSPSKLPSEKPIKEQPQPTKPKPIPTRPPVSSPQTLTPYNSIDNEISSSSSGGGGGGSSNGNGFVIALIVLICLFAIIGSCFVYHKRKYSYSKGYTHDNDDEETDPISEYLTAFDYGDIEIKHSATGGYHGIYTNPKLLTDGDGHGHGNGGRYINEPLGPHSTEALGGAYPYRENNMGDGQHHPSYHDDMHDANAAYDDVDIATPAKQRRGQQQQNLTGGGGSTEQDSVFLDEYELPSLSRNNNNNNTNLNDNNNDPDNGDHRRRNSSTFNNDAIDSLLELDGEIHDPANMASSLHHSNNESDDDYVSDPDADTNMQQRRTRRNMHSSYNGLLDAYDQTWNDVNPQRLPDHQQQPSGGGSGGGGAAGEGENRQSLVGSNKDAWGQEII